MMNIFDSEAFQYLYGLIKEREAKEKEEVKEEKVKVAAISQPKQKKSSVKKIAATSTQSKFEKDIQILSENFPEFKAAYEQKLPYIFMIDLHSLFDLIPKSARKKDRYDALKRHLHEQGIELVISSKKEEKESE